MSDLEPVADHIAGAFELKPDGRANNGATNLDSLAVPTFAELQAAGREEIDEIEEDAFFLLRRRLKHARGNPGKAGRIEDTHLISLCTNLLKIRAARDAKNGAGGDGPGRTSVNILTFVEGLPIERGRELLVKAIRQMESAGRDAGEHREALAAIVGADETERLLAIDA